MKDNEMSFKMSGQCDENMTIELLTDEEHENGIVIIVGDDYSTKTIPVDGKTFQRAVNAIMQFIDQQ